MIDQLEVKRAACIKIALLPSVRSSLAVHEMYCPRWHQLVSRRSPRFDLPRALIPTPLHKTLPGLQPPKACAFAKNARGVARRGIRRERRYKSHLRKKLVVLA